MAAYQEHALAVVAALRDLDGIDVVPDPPDAEMFHLLLHRDAAALSSAALKLAREDGIWTFHRPGGTDVPNVHRWEIEVGAATLEWPPAEARGLVERLPHD